LGLALDEPKGDDEQFDTDGMTFLVGKDLSRFLWPGQAIRVDFNVYQQALTVKIWGGPAASC